MYKSGTYFAVEDSFHDIIGTNDMGNKIKRQNIFSADYLGTTQISYLESSKHRNRI